MPTNVNSLSDTAKKYYNPSLLPQTVNKSAVVSNNEAMYNRLSDTAKKYMAGNANNSTQTNKALTGLQYGSKGSEVSGYTPKMTRTEADIDKDIATAKSEKRSAILNMFNVGNGMVGSTFDVQTSGADNTKKVYDDANNKLTALKKEKENLKIADLFVEIDSMDASTINALATKGSSEKNNPLTNAENLYSGKKVLEEEDHANGQYYLALHNMTNDQKTIYNALYATDPKKADIYFEFLKNNTDLNEKTASAIYDSVKDSSVGKTLLSYASGFAEGGTNLVSGTADLITGNTTVKGDSANSQVAGIIRQNSLDENGKPTMATKWYDIMNSTGNMTPGLVASIATGTPLVGNTVFALSQAGGAYREAINGGSNTSQATAYALQQGADEAVTNWLLGGISEFGGGALKNILKDTKASKALIKGIDKIAKTDEGKQLLGKVMSWVANAGSEGVQEFVQYFTEGLGKQIFLGEDFDVNMEDAWYSAEVGVLNAFLLNAKQPASAVVNASKTKNINTGITNTLTDNASDYANENVLKASQRLKGVSNEIENKMEGGKKANFLDKLAFNSAQNDFVNEVRMAQNKGEVSDSEFKERVDALAEGFGGQGKVLFKEEANKLRETPDKVFDLYTQFSKEYNSTVKNLTGENIETENNTKTKKGVVDTVKGLFKPEYSVDETTKGKIGESAKSDWDADSVTTENRIRDLERAFNSNGKLKKATVNTNGVDLSKVGAKRRADLLIQESQITNMGINVKLVQSGVDANGNYVGENGSYIPSSNTIVLDVNAGAEKVGDDYTYNTIVSHELTHWMELYAPKAYRELSNIVLGNTEDLNSKVSNEIKNLSETDEASTRANALSEIIARSSEDAYGMSKTAKDLLKNMSEETKAEIQKHLDEIGKNADEYFETALSQYESNSAEAKAIREHKEVFDKVIESWDKALSSGIENTKMLGAKPLKKDDKENGEKFSFRGENSVKIFETKNLNLAKDMDSKGIDSEKIRVTTGWFKGLDGKWRNEIDDSVAKLKISDAENKYRIKEEKVLETLDRKLKNGSIDENSYNWQKNVVEERISKAKENFYNSEISLGDILDHPTLFKYYPELKETPVRFTNMDNGYRGSTRGFGSHILLSNNFINASEKETMQTLMHEIQHQIQDKEGFAAGGHHEDWLKHDTEVARKKANEERNKYEFDLRKENLSKKFEITEEEAQILRDYGDGLFRNEYHKNSTTGKENIEYALNKSKEYPNITKDMFNYVDEQFNILKESVNKIPKPTRDSAIDKYFRTAGEIESRDVASRVGLSNEDRKLKRPDIDRTDAVFSEEYLSKGSLNGDAKQLSKPKEEAVLLKTNEDLKETFEKGLDTKKTVLDNAIKIDTKKFAPEELYTKKEATQKFSRRLNSQIMAKAEDMNDSSKGKTYGHANEKYMTEVKALREKVSEAIKEYEAIMPKDIPGETLKKNASYGVSNENTLLCPRSFVPEAFLDIVSEKLGRPLNVNEAIISGQIVAGLMGNSVECVYCYNKNDRIKFREYFNTYYKNYTDLTEKVSNNKDAYRESLKEGISLIEGKKKSTNELFNDFLKQGNSESAATNKQWERYKRFVQDGLNGTNSFELKDLATENSRNEASKDSTKAWFMKDADRYSKSSARPVNTKKTVTIDGKKEKVEYVTYNGSILKMTPEMVDKLNSEYGLRLYSYSDYMPHNVLEDIQKITDASVRGLKVLAYTKDTGFARLVADSGAAVNISIFGSYDEKTGEMIPDEMQGASWEEAKKIREEYPNIGIVFVATNDNALDWALKDEQSWLDVVIPFHTVMSGAEVAQEYGFKDYKGQQADTKKKDWNSSYLSSIPPTVHGNNREEYFKALEENHLEPRFAQYKDNPNYMKLVNETRMSYKDLKPVQPKFNEDVVMNEVERIGKYGMYNLPEGLSDEAEFGDIINEKADEAVNKINNNDGNAKYSLRNNPNAKVGININDNVYGFTDAILDENENGRKTIETRNTPSLRPYIGQTVGLVRTGKGKATVVGYAKIVKEIEYNTAEDFYKDSPKHLINPDNKKVDDKYGFKDKKYGYVLEEIRKEDNPYVVTENGIVARDIDPDVQKKYSNRNSSRITDGENIESLEKSIKELKDEISNAEIYGNKDVSLLNERLSSLEKELKTLESNERKLAVKTSIDDILNNLDNYRRVDLRSLAEQISNGAWDYDENTTNEEFKEGIRRELDTEDYTPLERQSKRFGYYVRPITEDIKYSTRDTEGKTLSKNQQEYFKDSKVRDENGNLLVVYHTTSADFTVFDNAKKGDNTFAPNTYMGFFFTDNSEYFTNGKWDAFNGGKTQKYYIDIKNPIDFTNISREAFSDIIESLGGDSKEVENAKKVWDKEENKQIDLQNRYGYKDHNVLLSNVYEKLSGEMFDETLFIESLEPHYNDLMSKGYDGVINYLDEMEGSKEYIVLDSNQAKLTSNEKPTSNPDIRYSNRNTATFNGKDFWSGAVNLTDGVIEEVHSIDEAKNADFHHSLYFSDNAVENIDNGEYGFFWVEDGEVNGEWRDNITDDVLRKIKKQISIKENYNSNGNLYSRRGGNETDVVEDARKTFKPTQTELDEQIDKLIEKYGVIPRGENPKSNVDRTPAKTADKEIVRQYVRTVVESGALTDETYKAVQKDLLDGKLSYQRISDASAESYASSVIEKEGVDGARKEWDKLYGGNVAMTKNDIVLGESLLMEYAKANDVKGVTDMVTQLSAEGTRAGQDIQAMRILKKLATENPQIGLAYIRETTNKMSKEYNTEIKIDEDLAAEYLSAETKEEIDSAKGKLYKDIADQVPNKFVSKLNAYRYMAMLWNPKTWVRNLKGNALFVPAVTLKNTIAYGLEKGFNTSEKTKSIIVNRDAVDFAKKDFAEYKDTVKGESTASIKDDILMQKYEFDSKVGRWFEDTLDWALNNETFGDTAFLKLHYTTAMSQYMTANNLTAKEMTGETLAKARAYATREAQKATYRDVSQTANWLNSGKKNLPKVAQTLLEGIMPFKKTPINILKRGVEYSPIGLAYSLGKLGVIKVNNDIINKGADSKYKMEFNGSELADSIASGISGTTIAALGMILANLGIVKGKFEDDDDKTIEKLKGYQEYSIKLGDISYTIDWAAPAAMPFFVGVELNDLIANGSKDMTLLEAVNSLYRLSDPMQELSMLQGVNDAIESVAYADSSTGAITTVAGTALFSYLGQFVPTLLGQLARTVDRTQRVNYHDKNWGVSKELGYFQEKIQNKIPGWSMLNDPYVDEWGNENVNDSVLGAAYENFLSSGYINKVDDNDKVTNEIERINKSGEATVTPSKVDKYYKDKNGNRVDLSSSEWTQYQQTAGKASYAILDKMFDDKRYSGLTTEQKAKAIKYAYEYAKAVGRKTVQKNYTADKWIENAIEEYGNNNKEAYDTILNKVTANIVDDEIPIGENGYSYVSSSKFTDEQKSAWLHDSSTRDGSQAYIVWKQTGGSDSDYIDAKAYLNSLEGDDEKQSKWIDYISDFNDTEKEALWKMAGYSGSSYKEKFSSGALKLAAPKLNSVNKLKSVKDRWTKEKVDSLGRYGKGNIDLYNRPQYKQSDGTVSTVNSISIEEDGKEVLIPTIRLKDGKAYQMTDDEAIKWYEKSGEYLGKFNTVEEADEYAEALHKSQSSYYSKPKYLKKY